VSPISAPADKRFRRAHIKPARRRGKWRGLIRLTITYGVLVLIAVYGVYRGGGGLMHARLLQVDRILVRGTERLSSGEVLAVLAGLRGENIVWADLAAWRLRLLSSPWVRDAGLRRLLPSTVEVVVSERQPIGIARIDGRLYLIDERAVVLDSAGRNTPTSICRSSTASRRPRERKADRRTRRAPNSPRD
jgi:cell division septal protein FtsQ